MTHSADKIFQALLVQLGVATLPSAGGDWPVTPNMESSSPDNVITVYQTDPSGIQKDQHGSEYEMFGIQVRVRDKSPGDSKSREILEALSPVHRVEVSIGDSNYLVNSVHRESGPMNLGKAVSPANGCYLYTTNYVTQIEEV